MKLPELLDKLEAIEKKAVNECGCNSPICETCVLSMRGIPESRIEAFNAFPTLIKMLRIAREALENCTAGDLSSGEGIYKAELARKALAELDKLAEEIP